MRVGARKLKNLAIRIIRHVRSKVKPEDDVWADLEALRQEIGRSWTSDRTAVELVSEQRR